MDLTQIYAKLPITYTNVLDRYIEEAAIPVNPSRAEVFYAATQAVNKTKQQLGTILVEHANLFNEVPEAMADYLVG